MRTIDSLQNRALREARKLKHKKSRAESQRFFIEGVRLVTAAMHGKARVLEAFVTQELIAGAHGAELLGALESSGAEVMRVPEEGLRSLADTESPQGIVAIVENVLLPLAQLPLRHNPVLLVLDGVGDPGNLGTLIRTAWSQGAHGVIVGEDCCDPLNPKAVRASMGALFHLPVAIAASAAEIGAFLAAGGVTLVGAASGEGVVCDRFNFPRSVALAVGSETRGLSAALRECAAAQVTIPEQRSAESLNAAAAGAILLYETMRQRRSRGAQVRAVQRSAKAAGPERGTKPKRRQRAPAPGGPSGGAKSNRTTGATKPGRAHTARKAPRRRRP